MTDLSEWSEYVGICRNMSEYVGMVGIVGICRNMSEYVGIVGICRKMTELSENVGKCRNAGGKCRNDVGKCRNCRKMLEYLEKYVEMYCYNTHQLQMYC